eukprot:scaffold7161_cov109-Isochrysis_galbana.AAC.3
MDRARLLSSRRRRVAPTASASVLRIDSPGSPSRLSPGHPQIDAGGCVAAAPAGRALRVKARVAAKAAAAAGL